MKNENQITQVYNALRVAGEKIGYHNYLLQLTEYKKTHKSVKNFRFTVTPEHKEIVEAMAKVLDETMTPEAGMALLWQYDTMKQRGL
jgi:hypothetical protein